MTCHVENFLCRIATFSQFWVYLNVTQAKQMISLLLLNHFYPAIDVSTGSKERESDELLYTVRSLVMVRATSCQAQGVKTLSCKFLLLAIRGAIFATTARKCIVKSSPRSPDNKPVNDSKPSWNDKCRRRVSTFLLGRKRETRQTINSLPRMKRRSPRRLPLRFFPINHAISAALRGRGSRRIDEEFPRKKRSIQPPRGEGGGGGERLAEEFSHGGV